MPLRVVREAIVSYVEEFLRALGEALVDKFRIGGRNISDGITEALDYSARTEFVLFGRHILITDAVIALLLSSLISLILALVFRYRLRVEKTSKRQVAIEAVYTGLLRLGENLGLKHEQAENMVPWILSFMSLITFSSLVDLVKLRPAAQNPAFPVTLALFALVFVIAKGIQFAGLAGFFRSLIHPMPALIPFQILDYCIKPVSLAFRLFGNIFGSFVLVEFVSLVIPFLFPTALGLWFDLGDGILQSVVFSLLCLNYVAEIVEKNEEMLEAKLHHQRSQRGSKGA